MSLEIVAMVMLSVVALMSAAIVVFHRSPIVSALALAFNLISIAGFYLLLSAEFLALLQVIVYAGAIMVLILFVIMLLNLPDEARLHKSGFFQKWLGALLALAFAALVGAALYRGASGGTFAPPSDEFGTVEALGRELFSTYFYPFEAISLLLVVAMIGAVLLAKRRL
jgi:NADH-quinone oxidoreductase subunit J